MFRLIKYEQGAINVPEPEYYDAKASEAIERGEALTLTAGALTKCTGGIRPTHIALGAVSASETEREIAVCRVDNNQQYEVPVSAAPTTLKVGDKVTIATSGTEVTSTTTDGVATIVNLNGAAKTGDRIVVRFA